MYKEGIKGLYQLLKEKTKERVVLRKQKEVIDEKLEKTDKELASIIESLEKAEEMEERYGNKRR